MRDWAAELVDRGQVRARVECAEGTGRVTGQVDAGTGLLPRPLPLHDFGREPGERSGGAETGDASADDEDASRGRGTQGPYPVVLGAMLRLTRNRLPGSYFSFTSTRRSKLLS
jgi:hypothetical protein